MKLSPNCCYCEKPHGKSSPLVFQSCDACQDERDKRATDASNGLMSVSCPRCDLQFSADATHSLTDAERDDIRVWLAECLRQASAATEGGNEELAERWQGRAKRAAAMIERTGGEK
jgi:hypothetical protein